MYSDIETFCRNHDNVFLRKDSKMQVCEGRSYPQETSIRIDFNNWSDDGSDEYEDTDADEFDIGNWDEIIKFCEKHNITKISNFWVRP